MVNLKKLDSGISVYSYKGVDGIIYIKTLNKNETYKLNVWFSNLNSYLDSLQIHSSTDFCQVCGCKLDSMSSNHDVDFNEPFCSLSCYESRDFGF